MTPHPTSTKELGSRNKFEAKGYGLISSFPPSQNKLWTDEVFQPFGECAWGHQQLCHHRVMGWRGAEWAWIDLFPSEDTSLRPSVQQGGSTLDLIGISHLLSCNPDSPPWFAFSIIQWDGRVSASLCDVTDADWMRTMNVVYNAKWLSVFILADRRQFEVWAFLP